MGLVTHCDFCREVFDIASDKIINIENETYDICECCAIEANKNIEKFCKDRYKELKNIETLKEKKKYCRAVKCGICDEIIWLKDKNYSTLAFANHWNNSLLKVYICGKCSLKANNTIESMLWGEEE